MSEEIKVLIVDDHEIVRQGFNLILSSQDELNLVVSELTDGEDVLALYKEEKFDIIFMDINMKNIFSCKTLNFGFKKEADLIQNGGQKRSKWDQMGFNVSIITG